MNFSSWGLITRYTEIELMVHPDGVFLANTFSLKEDTRIAKIISMWFAQRPWWCSMCPGGGTIPIGSQTIYHGPSFRSFNNSLDSAALYTNHESKDQLSLWSSLGRGVTENKFSCFS